MIDSTTIPVSRCMASLQVNEENNDHRESLHVQRKNNTAPTNVDNNNNTHNEEDDDDDNNNLPNLANLVAATLRDKVVLDQMAEIRALKQQLNSSSRVEITGPNGCPIYACGNFNNGDFNTMSLKRINDNDDDAMNEYYNSNGNDEFGLYWDVGLQMNKNIVEGSIPLKKLNNIEIRIGGVVYVTSSEVEGTSIAFGIRPGNKFDLTKNGTKDMSRSAVCEFNTEDNTGGSQGGRAALLTFHVRDFPRGHWRSLQSVAMLNRSIALQLLEREEEREERREMRQIQHQERIERGEIDEDEIDFDDESDDDDDDQEPLDVYNYLTTCLSKRHPGQRCDITSVSLCVKSVRGRIESIRDRGQKFENIKERMFRKIDEMYQEEQEEFESQEDDVDDVESVFDFA